MMSVLEAYAKITGYKETNVSAIWHDRVSLYGPPYDTCGNPLRIPPPEMCGSCMRWCLASSRFSTTGLSQVIPG